MTSSDNKPDFQKLRKNLERVMSCDRHKLRQRLNKIERLKPEDSHAGTSLEKWLTQCQRSIQCVEKRKQQIPDFSFPEQLPVSQRQQEIAELIKTNQVVILAGETGSGKTTQIPKICLQLGRGQSGIIAHTQPRRLAARTVAARIAEELNVTVGNQVGYQVRFTDHSNENTLVKLMTDGILLAEIHHDRFLAKYDTLIIDEAHERSLNIDFLLGYIKNLLPKRPDLKVIITSATIDLERFSEHFNNAPIIEVSGRSYPVDILYRPTEEWQDGADQAEAIIRAIEELIDLEGIDQKLERNGDILVFLSGEREIREAALAIRRAQIPHCEVFPLYARLSAAEQNRVFDLRGKRGRRIVLATNVAETSLTVPGIHYVIDPGVARISRYSYRTKVQRLPIEPVSQASANQRAGRCGRIRHGVCIRLYSEEDFLLRPEYTDAEIQRTNLASVILQTLNMGLGDIDAFPFLDPPDRRMVSDGYKLLEELGGVSNERRLNKLGRSMAKLPVDPRIARMILAAEKESCVKEMLIVAAALSIQDPRERPVEKKQAADEKHRRFADDKSDFVSLINLWNYFEEQRQALSQNQLRKLCKKEFLSYIRMREWRDIHYQLRLSIKTLSITENQQAADFRSTHRAILAGLLSHVGFKHEEREYMGARNRRFKLFPGSFLFKKQPKWLVAAELVETTQLYARMAASIEPDWLFGIGDHLFKRSYSEPHWQQRRGQVLAFEKVSLYGLVISEQQKVNYALIDPGQSREIFIRSALVEGHYKSNAVFYQHNRRVMRELDLLEAKARRRDIMADEQILFDFYEQRIPADICSASSLEKWLRKTETKQPDLLKVDRSLLMQRDAVDINEQQFPDQIVWGDLHFKLQYRFEPGHQEDGVSARIPIGALNRLPSHLFEWVVPGLLRDKCIALVKSLPKQLRKSMVPVPDYVDRALANLKADDVSLMKALAEQLWRLSGVKIAPDQWNDLSLDPFYCINFKIVDGDGKVLGQGRDLALLIEQFRDRVQQSLSEQTEQQSEELYTGWSFADLSQVHTFRQAGVEIQSFPALVDHGEGVSVELSDYSEDALLKHRSGLIRLFMLAQKKQLKYLKKELFRDNASLLRMSSVGNKDELLEDAIHAIFNTAFLADEPLPRSKADFEEKMYFKSSAIVSVANDYEKALSEIFTLFYEINRLLKGKMSPDCLSGYAEINHQLDHLIYKGFVFATPYSWLQQYPRYLMAIKQRLEKMPGQLQKDRLACVELKKLSDRLWQRSQQDSSLINKDPEMMLYRWMLEEYRVSLFAQQLGTKMPVSVKRLDKQWQKVQPPH